VLCCRYEMVTLPFFLGFRERIINVALHSYLFIP
jgi:hypothetical protein